MRILYLDIDTLRPDHMGCYGYRRNTSPNLDRIAARGARFDQVYCSDAPCLPSRSALVTGRFGIHNGVVNHGGQAACLRDDGADRGFRDRLDRESMFSMLRQAGLSTALISSFPERHSAWWFYAGFQEMHNSGQGGMESAEEVTPVALRWIKDNAKRDNWYLHLNYWDPHTPYRAPKSFGNPFAGQELPPWLTPEVLKRHQQCVGPHSAREINMWDEGTNPSYPRHPGQVRTMKELRGLIDGYDCGIRYLDGHIGRVMAALKAQGVLDDTAIIVSADHGENFGELGIYAEHGSADAATCRIPMIIRWPKGGKPGVARGLRYNIDLAPTLAQLLGVGAPAAWDGVSFAGAVTGQGAAGRDHLVLSQMAHVCQRSVRFGDWLYMRTWHDGFHLFADEMLFDLASDPGEQKDVAPLRPRELGQARRLLADWTRAMMKTQPGVRDPLKVVLAEGGPFHAKGALKRYCARLKKTGRAWAVPLLKKKHPGEFA